MSVEISATQQKRLDKIERLRQFYGDERAECFVWIVEKDEALDFKSMTDEALAKYLASSD